MITKTDKGKTCVIIYNNFQKLPKDPTNKYPKKRHPYPKTLQPDYPQKRAETPHPKETPIALLKRTNQNTKTRQPYQTGRQKHKHTIFFEGLKMTR